MKSVIVATAGHIDHGKTALIKALTGIDADRLQEEKRRGITIDLGFAHFELPSPQGETLRIGFVDVPGHERFVRNMLAGVGSIDLVLLVIAADDSIKPQTREHLDICQLLHVPRAVVAITKSDLVNREMLEVVRLEVEEFLRGSFLDSPLDSSQPADLVTSPARSKAEIVAVSSLTGAGLPELKNALSKAALGAPARDPSALARLPIDRVFTMKGFGTVVTGTLVSGTIREGDELEVFPGEKRVRVRNIQVHGTATTKAVAGERTALNLAGTAKDELARGMTLALAPPGTLRAANLTDVWLRLLPSAKPMKNRSRIHLHVHSTETVATVTLYDQKQISAGEQAFARLKMENPTLLLPGDRFVIRQFSPLVTIGGGVILDTAYRPRATHKVSSVNFLETLRRGSPEAVLLARIARRRQVGLTLREAAAETGWTAAAINATAQTLLSQRKIVRSSDLFLAAEVFGDACSELAGAVAAFQKSNPLVEGISREQLREQLGLGVEVFSAALEHLLREKQVEISGEQIRLLGHGVVLKDEEAASKQLIESAFASAGLRVPALKEVLLGLKVDLARAQKIVTLLLRDKSLVKVSDDLVFHRDALTGLRKLVIAEKANSPKMDIGRFKHLTGVSRKYAIPLLEYLDRERVTRRVGNDRLIL